ncbi:hypothetical protein IW147_000134 [Coemansia sp. RSA 720]|nr:hypothetical protein IW147_000134 [Coemansia sp. RSA 720]
MKFGKTIETNAKELPEEWQPYLIQYKLLKKNIKNIVQELDNTFKNLNIAPPTFLGDSADDASDSTHVYVGTDAHSVAESSSAAQAPMEFVGVPEEIAYNIEKDSDGLVHPVITVKIRRLPTHQQQQQHKQIVELLTVAGRPENTSIILQSDSSSDTAPISISTTELATSTLGDNRNNIIACADDAASPNSLAVETQPDAEETQVTVRLKADQLFFDQLIEYIERMRQFEQRYTKAYNTNVDHLSTELATVTSPYKQDYQVWREIFRLYTDAEVWNRARGDTRPASTAREGQERFNKFARHIESLGLAQRFRNPMSARVLMSFYKLNLELTHMKLLQEMNEEATRKIIKKHDKRTHLVAKTQFPQLITIDTTSLTRALLFTIYTDLVGIVPQIDDYLCPMCLNIAWRPLRLECSHVFCSRCVVKASKRRMFNCPVCRSENAVYRASISNIDQSLLNFLKLYFPKEIKERQRDIQRDISEEEAQAMTLVHDRSGPVVQRKASVWPQLANRAAIQASTLALTRSLSSSTAHAGQRKKYEGRPRYPQPHSTIPPRPIDIATNSPKSETKTTNRDSNVLETIRLTDDEVGEIYNSIMSPSDRQERDEQSMRHRSRTEFLELRRQAREKTRERLAQESPKEIKAPEVKKKQDVEEKPVLEAVKARSISDKAMERLVYVDTRVVREMEEAKNAVMASVGPSSVDHLQEKVEMVQAQRAVGKGVSEQGADQGALGVTAYGLSASEFNHVIFANTLACNVDEAMRTYELMQSAGVKPNQTTFANLTIVHAKAGDLESAVSMFKKLESEGLEPTVYSYGSLIRAYMEFNRVDDSFRVYEMMKTREVWPNLPVYNSLIVSCLKVGDFARAWGVFEHLRYTIAQPDEVSFTIMIHACAKQGQVEKAMNLFEEMVASNLVLSDVTFNSLIHACAVRTDYFDECFRLLELMEAQGFQPDFYTYNTVIYACARARKLGLAREIFRDMLKKSMRPDQEDLLKIDAITITNMMCAYAWYLPSIKNCSWKVAKRFEGIAAKALADVQQAGASVSTNSLSQVHTRDEHNADAYLTTTRLLDIQEKVAKAGQEFRNLSEDGASKPELDQQQAALIDMLMPEQVPEAHNQLASETVRLMRFYLDTVKGGVTARMLNMYLAALVNNGRFESAWRVIFGDFEKYGLPRDGWTFLWTIRLCARTRDVPSAWRVWDEFKKWRADVERELNTPGHNTLRTGRTRVYGAQSDKASTGAKPKTFDDVQSDEPSGDSAANRATRDMLALVTDLEFPGSLSMPTNVAGGALAVTADDREVARKLIGCDMKPEHATYIEMITLLGSCGDFRSAVHLLREEKEGILEHKHDPTMQDVGSMYQNALVSGNKHAALDVRGLCMPKPLHEARRKLHRKWGTSFGWELTSPQYKAVSRRFPEEFKPHNPPFKNGEHVYSRSRGSDSAKNT